MGLIVQALVSGLAAGAVYGLVGLGYGLIYRMSGVLDFAHGDLVTAGIFIFLLVLGGGAAVGSGALPVTTAVVAVVLAVAITALLAAAVQRTAVAPFLGRASATGWIAATVAAGLFLRALVAIRFQAESYAVPDVLPVRGFGHDGLLDLPGGGVLQARSIAVLLIALGLAVGFDRWLNHSRRGRAMRAATQDPDAARLTGISPERQQLVAWLVAGALAAVAGVLLAPARPVTLDLGIILGLKGTAAAVLAGLGSSRRTVIAGLAVGVAESLLTTLPLPVTGPLPGLQDVGALLLLVVALACLPGLLAGSREAID